MIVCIVLHAGNVTRVNDYMEVIRKKRPEVGQLVNHIRLNE